MSVIAHINAYIASQKDEKRNDLQQLHQLICELMPNEKLWFEDGKDANGKVISNPNIGYGTSLIHYANGSSREFYKIGISANTTGISLYIMGLHNKTYLVDHIAARIGKAKVTSYCIKFKNLSQINVEVLSEAIRYSLNEATS
jgi:hypothetical protein